MSDVAREFEEAINGCDLAKVRSLIAAGADVNQPIPPWSDEGIYTPLLVALERGYEDIIYELIQSGADVNLHFDGFPPLFSIADFQQPHVFSWLVEKGVNLFAKNQEGRDILDVFVDRGRHRLIGYLQSIGFDLSVFPLYQKDAEVRYWIDNVIPVGEAIWRCDAEFLRQHVPLLKDVNAPIHGPKLNIGSLVMETVHANCPSAVRILLENGANADVIEDLTLTPLILAIRLGRNAVARALVEGGCNVNLTIPFGSRTFTAYQEAVDKNNLEMMALLALHQVNL